MMRRFFATATQKCGYKLRKAIYAGSFDPPSVGHLDIINRTLKLVDKIYVAIAINPDKR